VLKAGVLISLSAIVFTPKFDDVASTGGTPPSVQAAMAQPAENLLAPLPRKDMRIAESLSTGKNAN
jgi:hypothetical protein